MHLSYFKINYHIHPKFRNTSFSKKNYNIIYYGNLPLIIGKSDEVCLSRVDRLFKNKETLGQFRIKFQELGTDYLESLSV